MAKKKLLTLSEIAELTGFAVPTVSNWIRRFDDFPQGQSVEGSKRPRYELDEVLKWIEQRKLSRGAVDQHASLLSIDRERRRDFLGTLFVVLQSMPNRNTASVSEVLKKFDELGHSDDAGMLSFEISAVPDVLSDLLPRYQGLSASELVEILSGTDDGLKSRFSSEFTTPDVLVEFIGSIAGPTKGRVLDLASGQGKLLEHLAKHGVGGKHTGIDVNRSALARAKQSARLKGLDITYFLASGIEPVDRASCSLVVVDPPLGAKLQREEIDTRPWSFARPSQRDMTTAFIQRAVEALEPGGTALVLSTATLLQAGGEVSELRRQLVNSGVVRGIVALPPRLKTNTAIPLALWILGPSDLAAESVVMVDASLSSPEDLCTDGPVVKAVLAELNHDVVGANEALATTVLIRDLLTRNVELRPNAWVAKKRDLIEPQEQLKVAIDGLRVVEELVGQMPVSSDDLSIGQVEPPLVSLQELQDRGSIKIIRPQMARASDGGSGRPILDSRILVGDRDPEAPRRMLDTSENGFLVEPGDIIVASGPSEVVASIWNQEGWAAGTGIQIVRVRDNSVNSQFLAAAIRHHRNLAHVDAGALRIQVNLSSFDVPDLPIEEQGKLALLLGAVQEAETELQSRLTRIGKSSRDITQAIGSGTVAVGTGE